MRDAMVGASLMAGFVYGTWNGDLLPTIHRCRYREHGFVRSLTAATGTVVEGVLKVGNRVGRIVVKTASSYLTACLDDC